jgi:hypothetical protein
MPVRRKLSRDAIIALREEYAAGELSTDTICKRYAIGPDTLCFWVDGGEPEGEFHFPPLPRRRRKGAPGGRQRRFSGRPAAVVRRLWRTAEAQMFEIEQRLISDRQQADEQERDARTLALLAKTVRDLTGLDQARLQGAQTAAVAADDDAGPEDIDEFRRELVRRMDEIVAQREAGTGQPPQSA